MLRIIGLAFMALMVTTLLLLPPAHATMISLEPAAISVVAGDSFSIDVMADIDEGDAIIAFGFDVSVSGSAGLAFDGFACNSPLFDVDPALEALSDDDGILGASGGDFLMGPAVSGDDVLLGSLAFTATGAGVSQISLGADDLAMWFTEGLIPVNMDLINFMPMVMGIEVTVEPIPEPATLMLLMSSLPLLAAIRRKKST